MSLNKSKVLANLRVMDEYKFEKLVADIWQERGWETEVTSGSNDDGVDVIATKNKPFTRKILIQAKRYGAGNKVSSPEVQQYSSLRQQNDNVDIVIIITTSSFSAQADSTAHDLNVKTINGMDLCNIIDEMGAADVLFKYIKRSEGGGKNVWNDKYGVGLSDQEPIDSEINQGNIFKEAVQKLRDAFEQCYEEDLVFINVGNEETDQILGYKNSRTSKIAGGTKVGEMFEESPYQSMAYNITDDSDGDMVRSVSQNLIAGFGFRLTDPRVPRRIDNYAQVEKRHQISETHDYHKDAILAINILYKIYGMSPDEIQVVDKV